MNRPAGPPGLAMVAAILAALPLAMAGAVDRPGLGEPAFGRPTRFVPLEPGTRSAALDGRMGFSLPPGGDTDPAGASYGFGSPPGTAGEPTEVWASFNVRDESGRDDWCISFYRRGFRLTGLALIPEGGTSTWLSGPRLESLAWDTGIPGVRVYRLPDAGSSRWTVYLRLSGVVPAAADFRVWRQDALAGRFVSVAGAAGVGLGALLAAAACLALSARAKAAARSRADGLAGVVAGLEREAEDRLGMFARAAESIKRPLLGMLDALDERLEAQAQGTRERAAVPAGDLALARAECLRLVYLAGNLQRYANTGRDEGELCAEPFDLAAVLKAVVASTRYLGAGKNLSWNLSLPIIEMRNDAKTMQHTLYTVLYRAIRSPGARVISVRASSDTHLVRLDISDDGVPPPGLETAGPSNDGATRDCSSFTDPDGRLADLELTGKLAARLGGSFSYERTDSGNRYAFVFPRAMSWPTRGSAPSPAPALSFPVPELDLDGAGRGRTGPGTIMIVDSEPVSLFTLKRKLESAGWRVAAEVSARSALGRMDGGGRIELVLVDSAITEMRADEFCARVRERFGRETLPIIVLVDSGLPREIEEAFQWGANDYLVRPAGGQELLTRVKTHVDLAVSIRRELEHRDRMAEVDKFKTLGWLTAGVAHEINTPNNSALRNIPMLKEIWAEIAGALDRLYRSEGEFNVKGFGYADLKREIPEMLNDLYMGSQHIKKIVEDLKDYARGPDPSRQVPLDVNLAMEYAARLLKHSIAVSTTAFSLRPGDGLPPVKGDRLKLTQVLVNVLENALQSLPSTEREVTMESFLEPASGARPARVCVRVRDRGSGMPPEVLASVFDPFFTTKRDRGGTGLGMSVAAGIIREMGGAIELRSTPGEGTTVLICMPVAQTGGGER